MSKLDFGLSKRFRISRAQRATILEVLVASLILGAAIVTSTFLIKYISFNKRVIAAKKDTNHNYESTIINVGICIDANKDGKISDKELKACDPNAIALYQIPESLRYNVMVNLSNNKDLESVGRDNLSAQCFRDGKRVDFSKKYINAKTPAEQTRYFNLLRECSSLRVIPDALPAYQNIEATMASLNQLFLSAGVEPESMTVNNSSPAYSASANKLQTIGLSWSANTSTAEVQAFLTDLERSIREFNINTAVFEWSNDQQLSIQTRDTAYYANPATINETSATVYGNREGVFKEGGPTKGAPK